MRAKRKQVVVAQKKKATNNNPNSNDLEAILERGALSTHLPIRLVERGRSALWSVESGTVQDSKVKTGRKPTRASWKKPTAILNDRVKVYRSSRVEKILFFLLAMGNRVLYWAGQ
jgi:hypothetical protein